MARPRIEINWEEFDKLCGMLCTQEEIAAWFKCSVDTIDKALRREKRMGFTEYFKNKAVSGRMSLRRAQFELAVKDKHPTMLIWLGKQHLDQTDKQAIEHTGKDGEAIAYTNTERAARLAALLNRGRQERDRQSDK